MRIRKIKKYLLIRTSQAYHILDLSWTKFLKLFQYLKNRIIAIEQIQQKDEKKNEGKKKY